MPDRRALLVAAGAAALVVVLLAVAMSRPGVAPSTVATGPSSTAPPATTSTSAPVTTTSAAPTTTPAPAVPTTTTTNLRRRDAARLPQLTAAPAAPPAAPVTLGAAPMLGEIATTQPVAFLTIDDGFVRHREALQLLQEAGIPVSLFLVSGVADDDPGYFADLQAAGATIQAHSIDHEILKGRPYDVQRHEICGSADRLGELFGLPPTLFRAPGGAYDQTTCRRRPTAA